MAQDTSLTGVRSGLQVFLQRKASQKLRNTLFNVMPTLEFMFALSGKGTKDGSIGLGRPRTGLMISSSGIAQAQKEKIFAERIYQPIVQTTKPAKTDAKAMGDYDSDPTVPAWETTNAPLGRFTQPRVKFSRTKMPYKVPHSEKRTAVPNGLSEGAAAKAIMSVYESETQTRMAVLCECLNDQLWGVGTRGSITNGTPTDEAAVTWDSIPSVAYALSDGTNGPGGTYCGVDRSLSQNAFWRGNYITASTAPKFADIIDQCNYNGFSGNGNVGFASRGMGVELIVVGGDLFKIAKAEAKAENYQVTNDGIREYPEFGFKREVVRIYSGNRPVYVFYDPLVPAAALAALSPSTWTVAIHPDSNFAISAPADQTQVEGGDEADTGTIAAEIMIACEVPSMNAYFTNVA